MTEPTQPPYQPQQPSAPPYQQPVYPPQQYAPQPGYPQQYPYPPQYYAAPQPKPVSPALWIGLGAFVVALVMTLVGDQTPMLNAQTPLAVGFLAALGSAAAAIVAISTSERAMTWSCVILAFALLIAALAAFEFYSVHKELAAAQQCLQDLIACGSR